MLNISQLFINTTFLDSLGGDERIFVIALFAVVVAFVAWQVISWVVKVIRFKPENNNNAVEDNDDNSLPQVDSPSSNNEEIIAVIAAAIAEAESETGGRIKFRVISFRRK